MLRRFHGISLLSASYTLRILAIHGAKSIQPWHILLDYFTTRQACPNFSSVHFPPIWVVAIRTVLTDIFRIASLDFGVMHSRYP